MQDEEKRKILKMLVSPGEAAPKAKNFEQFVMLADKQIKSAHSAENLTSGTADLLRKQESSLSLQVPITTMGNKKVTFSQVRQ